VEQANSPFAIWVRCVSHYLVPPWLARTGPSAMRSHPAATSHNRRKVAEEC
jgi:hypothetical protein